MLFRALCCLCLLAAWFTPSWAQAQAVYRFSPVNQWDINKTAAYWNPIIRYVSEKSGVKLELKIGRTSADTTAYVLAQEVEFVFSNHLFSPEREQLGWKVFGRRQTPPMHSQIIVPAASPITELAQLAGKDVAYPGPEALVAYKMRHAQLVEGFARREGQKYRVLWSSGPLHDLALMAAQKVPPQVVKAVAQAFIGMAADPKGRAVLHRVSQEVGLGQDAVFIASDGSEYGAFRDFYRTAPPSLR